MAIIQPKVLIEIDPLQPVPEICAVMMAVIAYQPDMEETILHGIGQAIEDRRAQIAALKKGGKSDANK
ncbi:hypothetical protein [Paenibacillus sp. FSL L8-0708]|uniref:hypothetical protein n=1 Tax=Paenibacillus sp. FSL L8-0708 TaxID=2975311 RepID=UPI0030FBA9B1